MGSVYVNYSVRTVDTARVADSLRRAQRVAVVTPPQAGYVVVYDQEADSQDTDAIEQLGKRLSADAEAVVLAVLNHDDEVFCYWLFECGHLVDTFNSNSEFFEEAGESFEAPGDPARLTAVLQVAERAAEVRAILQEEHDYAGDQHQDLAELLGLPDCSVGYGYKYVAQGELEEVPADQLIWINKP